MRQDGCTMPHTLLAFHAHPDDEALLDLRDDGARRRGGPPGHPRGRDRRRARPRLAATSPATGRSPRRRMDELRASAAALGVARVEHLGYADSGLGPEVAPDPPGATRFVRADVEEAAQRLAAILREEHVDVLLQLRAQRRLRPPRPPAGARRRPPRRRARRHAEGARGDGAARHDLPRHRPRREGLPLPAGVRPVELRPRLLGPQRDHPPDQRPPPHRGQAGLDARPRLAGERRRRRRPHAGRLPAHPAPALRPRLRARVVRRPLGAAPVDPIRRDVFDGLA